VELNSKLLIIGQFDVGMPLVDSEEDPQTDLFELVHENMRIIEHHAQIQDLLDEDHEVVNVHLYDGRHVEMDSSAEQFERAHHDHRSVYVEVLEEVGGEAEEGQDRFIAEVVQLDFL
jgi:hypothetical protein